MSSRASPSNVELLRRLPLAALALACGSAFGAQINPALSAAVRQNGSAEALIVLKDQSTPMLAPLASDADYKARRRALVDALRARAETQQSGLRAWLDGQGLAYRAFWISNLVLVEHVNARDLKLLSGRAEIARIETNPRLPAHLPQPVAGRAPDTTESIAWGVTKINAPSVWTAGDTGQGVVIAGEDTGYQWDHPALKSHYRGWDGTTADHNYNWHDSIHDSTGNPCGNDSPAPCDDFGHGTHTVGTMTEIGRAHF